MDRLFGGFIGIPAAWVERIQTRIRNQTERESIIQAAAAERLRVSIVNEEVVSRVVADMALSASCVPLINKMRVAELAIDEL